MKKSSQHYLVFYKNVSVYLEKMKPQTLKQFFTDETIKNYLTDSVSEFEIFCKKQLLFRVDLKI